jgi:site-specific recombinase XerD
MTDRSLSLARNQPFPVPALVADVGPEATKRFFEFFSVPIRNKNTRVAYYHAIGQFLAWCERAGFRHLEDIEPITVAAYIEQHTGSRPTVKQHMSAIRMFFSWLTEKGVLAMNPAREVQTPRFSRTEGKTPAPPTEEVQRLLDGIDTTTVIGLRDRALLGVMAYTFARVGAVVSLTKEDYFCPEKRSILRFSEKGGKQKEIPVHHMLEQYLDQYLTAAKLSDDPKQPLFKSTRGRSRKLGPDPMGRKDAWAMLKRRLRAAGVSSIYSNHSLRAAGITNFLENGGSLEAAQRMAGHADSRTTKLYDRRDQRILVADVERVRYSA